MNIQVTLLFIVATINSLLSLFVLFGKRDKTNIVYSIFVIFASLWAIGLAFFILEPDLSKSLYIANFYYISAFGIPIFFYYFSLIFLNKTYTERPTNVVIFLPLVASIVLFFMDKNFLLTEVVLKTWGKDVVINHTHYFLYSIFFIFFVLASYINLFKSYFSKTDLLEKNQLKFILWGTAIGFLFGMIFNLILPFEGDYRHIFIGPLFSLFMVASIAYAITKYRMFNMKVIVTETLVVMLWIFILVRTIIAENVQEQVSDAILLIATIIIGIFIMKSVRREVEQREKIENLAKDLAKSNEDLEKANDRLKELDQLKSEFLSLATHQIRAPLTAIKGYASLVLDGDYGEISSGVRQAVETIFKSCQNLVIIVSDFLDISRIEQGRMKYDLTIFDAEKLVEEIINELKPTIEKSNLKIDFTYEPHKDYSMHADIGKTKQVIGNIIDNAIKYTPHGTIGVAVIDAGDKTRIAVTDSGIGISADDIPKLFGKFIRTKDASKTNVIGTGLGLYVAKQMVLAQGGTIWVESPGHGKGSTFFVELSKK